MRSIRSSLSGLAVRALIDFPAHPNVGDSAIWLGERAYLRRRGADVAYTCDIKNYSKSRLARSSATARF